jgi:hypothetical protein
VWKKILVAIGGVVLAISIPLVALALTTNQTPAANEITSAITDATRTEDSTNSSTGVQDQPMVRQQRRIHADTGPPEGAEPVRRRLHEHETVERGGAPEMSRRNPDAPMTGCTGECTHDGQSGKRGAGQGGQRGQRQG